MIDNIWALVTYEENISINEVVRYFSANKLKAIISPIHDDINTNDNVFNKKHRHIMLLHDDNNNISIENVIHYLNSPRPFRVKNNVGYYEYLTHNNRPDKKQYSNNDIVVVGIDDINALLNQWYKEKYNNDMFIIELHNAFPNYSVKYVYGRLNEYMKLLKCDKEKALDMLKKVYATNGKLKSPFSKR